MSGNPDKLMGWGAIELYLGMERRAIIRAGYPRRTIRATGAIYAFKSELDAWERAQPRAADGHEGTQKEIAIRA